MKIALSFLLFFLYTMVFSQNVLSGILQDEKGNAIPFATFTYSDGRVFESDENGMYRIPDCLECTIYFHSNGTKKLFKKGISHIAVQPIFRSKKDSAAHKDSVTSFSKTFDSENFWFLKDDFFMIKETENEVKLLSVMDINKFYVNFNTEYRISNPIRLYDFQKEYAQGRTINGNLRYQSPETNEVFSFGPNVRTLSYGNLISEYYPQGNIVESAPNQHNSLKLYDENSIFSPLSSESYQVKMGINTKNYFTISQLVSYQISDNYFVENRDESYLLITKIEKKINSHSLKFTLLHNDTQNYIPSETAIANKIYYANSLLPIHFDATYNVLLANGLPRNYSQLQNNPYYIAQFSADKNTNYSTSVQLNWTSNLCNQHITFSRNNQTLIAGFAPNLSQVATSFIHKRKELEESIQYVNSYKHHFNNEYVDNITSSLQANYTHRKLRRTTFGNQTLQNFPNFETDVDEGISEQKPFITSINVGIKSIALETFFNDVLYESINAPTYIDFVAQYHNLTDESILGSYSFVQYVRNIVRRLDLAYKYGHHKTIPSAYNNTISANSLMYETIDINRYFPYQELQVELPLQAITQSKHSFFINYQNYFGEYTLHANIELYAQKNFNQYAPQVTNQQLLLKPTFDYKQKGINATFGVETSLSNNLEIKSDINFSYYVNEVTKIYTKESMLALSGFADVYKAIVLNQPLGVIIGSSFLRNSENQMIIGNHGFPMVHPDKTIIANPNPDFTVGFNTTVQWNNFKLNLNLDWQQGGTMCNGTKHVLNYFGKSQESALNRTITDYVFQGVLENGNPNTQAVSFYDINQPFEQNRWVRYGLEGIAEESVESATYVRINHISLSYVLKTERNIQYTFQIFVENPVIWSASQNSFATNSLWNSTETIGLDYFNVPMLQTVGLSLNLTF